MRQWFADQDIHRLRGPTNPSLNYELGLLIDGFDSPPTFMMTYNPPYYERLIESYGFRKTQDLYAFWGDLEMLPKITESSARSPTRSSSVYNVKLRPLDKSRFREDVEMFLAIYNRSLANTWGFVPMSAAEMQHMADGLRYLIVPDMAVAAEVDGEWSARPSACPTTTRASRRSTAGCFPSASSTCCGTAGPSSASA